MTIAVIRWKPDEMSSCHRPTAGARGVCYIGGMESWLEIQREKRYSTCVSIIVYMILSRDD
jgi:hypothetical protein